MSPRRVLVIAGALLLVFVSALTLHWRHSRQPVWEGKSVREWFAEFRRARPRYRVQAFLPLSSGPTSTNLVRIGHLVTTENTRDLLHDPAAKALKAFGTNAVPFLAAEVRKRDSFWAKSYRNMWEKIPSGIRRYVPDPPPKRDPIRRDAALALAALGTNGAAGVPAILEAYASSRFNHDYVFSINRLPPNPAALDQMLSAVKGSNLLHRVKVIQELEIRTLQAARILTNAIHSGISVRDAVSELSYFRSHAKPVLPALTFALTSSDPEIRSLAARTLARFESDAAAALPELINALSSRDETLRYESVRVMEAMGTNALPALGALSLATQDPSLQVQRASKRVLGRMHGAKKE